MRLRETIPSDMPGTVAVEVAGRKVILVPLRPTDPLTIGMKLREAVGIPNDQTEMDAETMGKALQIVPLMLAASLSLALYSDTWEFETPLLSRISKHSPAEVLAWADALDAELDSPSGRAAFPGDSLKKLQAAAGGDLVKEVEAEKNA